MSENLILHRIHLYEWSVGFLIFFSILTAIVLWVFIIDFFNLAVLVALFVMGLFDSYFIWDIRFPYDKIVFNPSSIKFYQEKTNKLLHTIRERQLKKIQLIYSTVKNYGNNAIGFERNVIYYGMKIIIFAQHNFKINGLIRTTDRQLFIAVLKQVWDYLNKNYKVPIEKKRYSNIFPAPLEL